MAGGMLEAAVARNVWPDCAPSGYSGEARYVDRCILPPPPASLARRSGLRHKLRAKRRRVSAPIGRMGVHQPCGLIRAPRDPIAGLYRLTRIRDGSMSVISGSLAPFCGRICLEVSWPDFLSPHIYAVVELDDLNRLNVNLFHRSITCDTWILRIS